MSSSPTSEVTSVDTGGTVAPVPAWAPPLAATVALGGAVAAAVWTAGHLHPDGTLRGVAVFAHLASLVLGFGSVLAVDWVALLWLGQRRTLADVLRTATNAHGPIWAGYAGLVLSGVLLEPDLANPFTQVKLALVVLIGWNGVLAAVVHRQLSRRVGSDVPGRQLLTSVGAATVSQVGWWGAMLIGFVNGR